jgi:hypothetical protein
LFAVQQHNATLAQSAIYGAAGAGAGGVVGLVVSAFV